MIFNRVKSADLLFFQLVNWSTSFLLFSTFVANVPPQVFAPIARAEVLLGLIGVFMMSLSLSAQGAGPSKGQERPLLLLRLSIVLIAGLGFLAGCWGALYIFAASAFAAVPAHLPLLRGYSTLVSSFLLTRILCACAAVVVLPYLSETYAAAFYFGPTVLYGTCCYIYYWRKLPEDGVQNIAAGAKFNMLRILPHALTTGLSTFVQAELVSQLILAMPGIAFIERFLRSAYSFCYPYTVRSGIWTKKRMNEALFLVISFLVVAKVLDWLGFSYVPLYFFGPLSLDVYLSALAGRNFTIDTAMLLTLLVFVISGYEF